MVIFLASSLSDVCLALQHNFPKVDGIKDGSVGSSNWCITELGTPCAFCTDDWKPTHTNKGATCQFLQHLNINWNAASWVHSHLHECSELDVILSVVSKGVTGSPIDPV